MFLSGCGAANILTQYGDYNISVEKTEEKGEIVSEIEPTEDITSMR